MTDGRIPGKWINEPRFAEMDVNTWCVLTKAIAWSNEAGTDGHIKRRYLSQFHPEGLWPSAYAELVDLGLWLIVDDGYQFTDWDKKAHQGGLGQATAEQVKSNKESNKERQRRYREKQATTDVTRDVTVGVTRDVGHDTTGQATTAEVPETTLNWPTATPGDPDAWTNPTAPGSIIEGVAA